MRPDVNMFKVLFYSVFSYQGLDQGHGLYSILTYTERWRGAVGSASQTCIISR